MLIVTLSLPIYVVTVITFHRMTLSLGKIINFVVTKTIIQDQIFIAIIQIRFCLLTSYYFLTLKLLPFLPLLLDLTSSLSIPKFLYNLANLHQISTLYVFTTNRSSYLWSSSILTFSQLFSVTIGLSILC